MRTLAIKLSRLIVLPLLLALASCQAANAKPAAESEIIPFHDRYNARQFAVLYDSADAELKASLPRDEFLRLGEGLHGTLGRVTATVPAGYHLNVGTGGTRVTLNYQTTFEKGEGVETFQFRVRGRKAMLTGYHINSPALLAN